MRSMNSNSKKRQKRHERKKEQQQQKVGPLGSLCDAEVAAEHRRMLAGRSPRWEIHHRAWWNEREWSGWVVVAIASASEHCRRRRKCHNALASESH